MLEQTLQAGTDLRNSEILDLDSWIRRYLIDEISGNIDSDLTSSYFYFSGGKFFGGPIWDYDMAFGNHYRNQEPWAFIAKNAWKRSTQPSPYYSNLYTNESFYRRMIEIYRTEFVPILQRMIHRDIDDQICSIQSASRMNSIRWRRMYDEWRVNTLGLELAQDPDALKSWLVRRVQFLNSAWLDNIDHCTVQFESAPGDAYWSISVEKGTCLETTYKNLVDTVWVDKQTGQPVDFQCPITQDMVVAPQIEETLPAEEDLEQQEAVLLAEETTAVDKKEFLFAGIFAVAFLGILLADGLRRGRERAIR